jgi:hypothetical protein
MGWVPCSELKGMIAPVHQQAALHRWSGAIPDVHQ